MKPYAEIVEDTGIPKSTLERYIKELDEEGLLNDAKRFTAERVSKAILK